MSRDSFVQSGRCHKELRLAPPFGFIPVHSGFIVGFIPKSTSMTKWRFRAKQEDLQRRLMKVMLRAKALVQIVPNSDFLKESFMNPQQALFFLADS